MKRIHYIKAFVLAMALGLSVMPGYAGAALTAKANHDHIKIDFFYNGSEVSVSGVCDPDVDLIVKIASPEGRQALKKKGKVGGVLWMNVGDLKFEDTPNLYFIRSSRKLGEAISAGEMEKNCIGYDALKKHVVMKPVADEADKARWFDEFVRFKESSRLYNNTDGGFTFGEKDGKHTYYMKFAWPYQAPPGDYLVTVYALKGGKVVERASSNVDVAQVGSVKALAGMARDRGALYGILSIAAALGAGFGVGLVFGKGGGAH